METIKNEIKYKLIDCGLKQIKDIKKYDLILTNVNKYLDEFFINIRIAAQSDISTKEFADVVIRETQEVNNDMWYRQLCELFPTLTALALDPLKDSIKRSLTYWKEIAKLNSEQKYTNIYIEMQKLVKINDYEEFSKIYLNILRRYCLISSATNELDLENRLFLMRITANLLCEYNNLVSKYAKTGMEYVSLKSLVADKIDSNLLIENSLINALKTIEFFGTKGFDNKEYMELLKLISKYNNKLENIESKKRSQRKVKEKNVVETSEITYKKESTREERMKLYEARKRGNHPYIDEESSLSSDEIENIAALTELIVNDQNQGTLNVNDIINNLPLEEFSDETIMLKELINRLNSSNFNVNSTTNKLMIKLNNMIKENISKKKNKKD